MEFLKLKESRKEDIMLINMIYNQPSPQNEWNDSIDGSKAKGTSKYLNDLIASVLTSNTNKLQIIKEITNLKKTIQELKIKSDGKYAKTGDDSLESQANSFFSNIMSVGRNNFISALNGDDMQFVDVEYSSDTDIEYANTLPDVQNEIHDRINERLMNEDSLRSTEAEKYIIYENLQPEYKILRSAMDNTWEVIAVDKDGHRIHDYPVPSKKDLGRMKFSSDGNYATDAYGRSYKVIEHYGI